MTASIAATILSTSPSVHVYKDSRSKTRDEDNMYMNVYWFPREAGYVFMYVWKKYLQQRIRYGVKDTHPFAFVSFDPRYLGEMMPERTQTEAHNKACESIGLEVSKFNGIQELFQEYSTNLFGRYNIYNLIMTVVNRVYVWGTFGDFLIANCKMEMQ